MTGGHGEETPQLFSPESPTKQLALHGFKSPPLTPRANSPRNYWPDSMFFISLPPPSSPGHFPTTFCLCSAYSCFFSCSCLGSTSQGAQTQARTRGKLVDMRILIINPGIQLQDHTQFSKSFSIYLFN